MYNNDNTPSWGRDNMPLDRYPASSAPVDPEHNGKARIKVIGVGGAGNNAVNRMIDAGITSASYIAVNTDAQILACSKAEQKIQIGAKLTKGLGAGADPEIGRAAAEEDKEVLVKAVENTDLLFITAGMGGGTGTGAAPVIAKIAKDLKILTVAVVTEPFSFEGKHRMDNTTKGLDNLRKYVDTLIIIPNEKIGDVVPKNAPMSEALRVADEVLKQGIRGIADLIVTPALINLDFADVKAILKDKGLAHMGVGVAKGENRIVEAVRLAVNCPLLETTIEGATGVILNVVGGNDLTFDEVRLAANLIHSVVDYSANIIFGACIDENIRDEVEVTVIATGFPSAGLRSESKTQSGQASRTLQQHQPAYYANQQSQQQRPQNSASPYGLNRMMNPTQPQRPAEQNPYQQQGGAPQRPMEQNPYQQQGSAPQRPMEQNPYQQQGSAPQRPMQQPAYDSAQQLYGGRPMQQPAYPEQQAQYGYNPQQGYNAQQGYNPQQGTTQQNYNSQQQPVERQGYPAQNAQPVPAKPAEAPAVEENEEEFDARHQKLPDFVKKLIGKKK